MISETSITTPQAGQIAGSFVRVTMTEADFWTTVNLAKKSGTNLRPTDLPEGLRALSLDQIVAITKLSACVKWQAESLPEKWSNGWSGQGGGNWHHSWAALRGERSLEGLLEGPAGPYLISTEAGDWAVFAMNQSLGLEVAIACNDRYQDLPSNPYELPPKRQRHYIDPSHLESVIPLRHRNLSLHNLAPKTLRTAGKPGVPLDRQQLYIDKTLDLDASTLCGWLISGHAASSKTTLQATWLKDILTFRSFLTNYLRDLDADEKSEPICIWSINAGSWLDAVEEWYQTPFAERVADDRPLLPDTIKKACERSKFRPILWIEELQGMELTPKRLKWFHNLLDAVYCEEGLIMANTNWTKEELRKHLPDATRRRMTGEGEGDRKHLFQSWDFHKAAEFDVKGKRTKAA